MCRKVWKSVPNAEEKCLMLKMYANAAGKVWESVLKVEKVWEWMIKGDTFWERVQNAEKL